MKPVKICFIITSFSILMANAIYGRETTYVTYDTANPSFSEGVNIIKGTNKETPYKSAAWFGLLISLCNFRLLRNPTGSTEGGHFDIKISDSGTTTTKLHIYGCSFYDVADTAQMVNNNGNIVIDAITSNAKHTAKSYYIQPTCSKCKKKSEASAKKDSIPMVKPEINGKPENRSMPKQNPDGTDPENHEGISEEAIKQRDGISIRVYPNPNCASFTIDINHDPKHSELIH